MPRPYSACPDVSAVKWQKALHPAVLWPDSRLGTKQAHSPLLETCPGHGGHGAHREQSLAPAPSSQAPGPLGHLMSQLPSMGEESPGGKGDSLLSQCDDTAWCPCRVCSVGREPGPHTDCALWKAFLGGRACRHSTAPTARSHQPKPFTASEVLI